MKTGIARTCATFIGPPRTTRAAITTRLPVMWAVNRLPRVKKPIRSTMPATMLNRGGSRLSNRGSTVSESARIGLLLRP